MEILGIGPSELLFIVVIALIVLGPKDMQKAGRTVGRWLNQLIRSDSWKVFQRTSAELRNLPRNLMRDANMELAEMDKELRNAIDPRLDPTTRSGSGRPSATGSKPNLPPSSTSENPAPAQSPRTPSSSSQTPTENDLDKK